jgi:hypothetical protein
MDLLKYSGRMIWKDPEAELLGWEKSPIPELAAMKRGG